MRSILRKYLRQNLIATRHNAYHTSVLPSFVLNLSREFAGKAAAMDDLIADVDCKMAMARLGGGSKAAKKVKNQGKKLPRER